MNILLLRVVEYELEEFRGPQVLVCPIVTTATTSSQINHACTMNEGETEDVTLLYAILYTLAAIERSKCRGDLD